MKVRSIFFIAIVAGFMTSCMKDPVACIDAPATATVNQVITFTNCSTDAHHLEWTFGDGVTSSDPDPTHAYLNAGTYLVTLTAMTKNMKMEDVVTHSVVVQ